MATSQVLAPWFPTPCSEPVRHTWHEAEERNTVTATWHIGTHDIPTTLLSKKSFPSLTGW